MRHNLNLARMCKTMTNEESESRWMRRTRDTKMTYGTVSKETKKDMTQLGKEGLRQREKRGCRASARFEVGSRGVAVRQSVRVDERRRGQNPPELTTERQSKRTRTY
jgi:hypothetical protein